MENRKINRSSVSQKILFVDDEPRLLKGIQRQLRKDFKVEIAESAQEGLQVLESLGPFALVVSDYNMPETDGIEFLAQVHSLYPETVLVMLTGRAELDIAIKALHKGRISRFLNKPCPRELLIQTLNDSLEQYRLIQAEKQLQQELEKTNLKLNALNNQLESLVEIRTQAISTQYQYVRELTQMKTSAQIADALIHIIQKVTQTNQVALFLNQDNEGIFLPHKTQQGKELVSIRADELLQGSLAQCLQKKEAVIVKPDSVLLLNEQKLFKGKACACIPLNTEKRVIGLLTISSDSEASIDKTQLETVKILINSSATALMNHWHLEIQTESQDAIIAALAKLSEYKDPETGAHLLRLKKYCELLCQILGRSEKYKHIISSQFTKDLVRSSPLHDIGKVGIADAILKKPGKLTKEEFEVMKTHTSIGGSTLRMVYEQYKSQSFIKCGMEVAYYHHEKWDGSGYPQGLKGENIPLNARILAVADVYDALTTRRVYKPSFSREKALEIIKQGSEQHFDPDVVTAFVENEDSFFKISEKNKV